MRRELCLCPSIPRLETATRVVLLMHLRETYSTTNTGRIASLALPNSEIRLRGLPGPTPAVHVPTAQGLVLFPSEDALILDQRLIATLPRPVTLLVPDGNWGQASRAARREPGLAGLTRVKLAGGQRSRYQLRKSPWPDALCTLEAIARALGELEGPAVRAELERLFELMVERTLFSRGALRSRDLKWPLPEPGNCISNAP